MPAIANLELVRRPLRSAAKAMAMNADSAHKP
jgi:hypothetical protein